MKICYISISLCTCDVKTYTYICMYMLYVCTQAGLQAKKPVGPLALRIGKSHIHTYVYIHTCIRIFIAMYVCRSPVHQQSCVRKFNCMHVLKFICTDVRVHAYIITYLHTYVHIHVYLQNVV